MYYSAGDDLKFKEETFLGRKPIHTQTNTNISAHTHTHTKTFLNLYCAADASYQSTVINFYDMYYILHHRQCVNIV